MCFLAIHRLNVFTTIVKRVLLRSVALIFLAGHAQASPPPARGSFLPTLAPLAEQAFSTSIAVSDRFVAAGSSTMKNGGGNGVAYVFDLYSANPTTPLLALRDPQSSSSYFGARLALSGNLLAVSAPGNPQGGSTPTEERSVLIYNLTSNTPDIPLYRISIFDTYDLGFGGRLAMSGTRLAVKRRSANTDKILIFDLTGPNPTNPILTIPQPDGTTQNFGSTFAFWNDLLAVSGSGKVFLYDLSAPNPTLPFQVLTNMRAHFGAELALSEKFLAVSCFSYNFDEHDVLVYSTPARFSTAPLVLPTTTVYGAALAISGPRVLVGAAGDPPVFEYPGHLPTDKVLVFSVNDALNAYQTDELAFPNPNDFGNFGRYLAATERRILVAAPNADGAALDSGQVFLYGDDLTPVAPKLQILDTSGAQLVNGQTLTDIGGVQIGTSESRDLLITNVGNDVLGLEAITLNGTDAEAFSVALQGNASVAPGSSVHLIVTFHPSASGQAQANVSIECNDPTNNPFNLPLAGLGATAHEYWRLLYFGVADSVGDAADSADPDGDGNSNLFEYVAGLDPTDPHSVFTVNTGLSAQNRVVEFGPIVATRVYELQAATDLTNPQWQTLTNVSASDSGNRRSVIDLDGGVRKFYRVQISREEANVARRSGRGAAISAAELNALRQR